MQPRSLQDILSELGTAYDPQVNSLRSQQALIPGQIQEEEKGLQAKQGQAFEDIVGGARRRGIGFSGIPLQEQAKYTSTEFLPALARLRQQGRQQAMSLEDAILGVNERRQTQALGIRQGEQSLAEQQRQFNENLNFQRQQAEQQRRAASAGSAANNAYLKALQGQGGAAGPSVRQDRPGSFAFFDAAKKPITAAQYSVQTGMDLRDLLYQMGSEGDQIAAQFYNQLASAPRAAQGQIYERYKQSHPHIFGGV